MSLTTSTNYATRTNRYQNDFSDRLMQLQEQQAALQAQSVFQTANAQATQNTQQTQQVEQQSNADGCTDGKDDGKLGFFEGLWSGIKGAVKGVVNGIKGCFTDENGNFSLKNTLKTVGTVALCCIPYVGPVIGAGLCAYGVAKGGIGVVKGAVAASQATTDAEAKAALEDVGANAATAAISAYGLKGSVGAIAKNAGVKGATTNSLRANIKALKGGETGLSGLRNIGTNIKNSAGFAKAGAKDLAGNAANSIYRDAFASAKGSAKGLQGAWNGAKGVAKTMGKGTIENISGLAERGKAKYKETRADIKKRFENRPQKATVENMSEFNPDNLNEFANPQKNTATTSNNNLNAYDDILQYGEKNGLNPDTSLKGKAKAFAKEQLNNAQNFGTKQAKRVDGYLSNKSKTYGKASSKVKGYWDKTTRAWESGKTSINSKNYNSIGGLRTVAGTTGSIVTQNGATQADNNLAYAQMNSAYANYSGDSSTINFQQGGYTLLTPEEIDARFAAIQQNTNNIRQAGMI